MNFICIIEPNFFQYAKKRTSPYKNTSVIRTFFLFSAWVFFTPKLFY